MSLGTFRLVFTILAFVITTLVALVTQISLTTLLSTVGFLTGVACFSDVLFIKIYMIQNKEEVENFMKEYGGKNGSDDQPE